MKITQKWRRERSRWSDSEGQTAFDPLWHFASSSHPAPLCGIPKFLQQKLFQRFGGVCSLNLRFFVGFFRKVDRFRCKLWVYEDFNVNSTFLGYRRRFRSFLLLFFCLSSLFFCWTSGSPEDETSTKVEWSDHAWKKTPSQKLPICPRPLFFLGGCPTNATPSLVKSSFQSGSVWLIPIA